MYLRIGRDLLTPQALPHQRPDPALTCAEVRACRVLKDSYVVAGMTTGFQRLADMAGGDAGHASMNGRQSIGDDTSQLKKESCPSYAETGMTTGTSVAMASKGQSADVGRVERMPRGRNGAALLRRNITNCVMLRLGVVPYALA